MRYLKAAEAPVVPMNISQTPFGPVNLESRRDGRYHSVNYQTAPLIQSYKRQLRDVPLNKLFSAHSDWRLVDRRHRSEVEIATGELIGERINQVKLRPAQQLKFIHLVEWPKGALYTDSDYMVDLRNQLHRELEEQCESLVQRGVLSIEVLLSIRQRANQPRLDKIDESLAMRARKLPQKELLCFSRGVSNYLAEPEVAKPSAELQEATTDELLRRLSAKRCRLSDMTLANIASEHPVQELRSLATDRLIRYMDSPRYRVDDAAVELLASREIDESVDRDFVANRDRLTKKSVHTLIKRLKKGRYGENQLYQLSLRFPKAEVRRCATSILTTKVKSHAIKNDYMWRDLAQNHTDPTIKAAAIDYIAERLSLVCTGITSAKVGGKKTKLLFSYPIMQHLKENPPSEQIARDIGRLGR